MHPQKRKSQAKAVAISQENNKKFFIAVSGLTLVFFAIILKLCV